MLLYFISNNKEKAMKKYFAKYLPVEGEIRKGLLVRNNLDGLIGECMREPSKEEIRDKEYSLVKLFLCSRDIQVGDSITLDGIEFVKYEAGEVDSVWYKHIEEGFKVIGEISPEAKWVKEGDEFDSSEILHSQSMSYENFFHKYESNSAKKDSNRSKKRYREHTRCIKIKGLCGHFH